jgi:hypothetical protein
MSKRRISEISEGANTYCRVFAHSDISEIYPWVQEFSPRISEISETNLRRITEISEILDRKICENHGFKKQNTVFENESTVFSLYPKKISEMSKRRISEISEGANTQNNMPLKKGSKFVQKFEIQTEHGLFFVLSS